MGTWDVTCEGLYAGPVLSTASGREGGHKQAQIRCHTTDLDGLSAVCIIAIGLPPQRLGGGEHWPTDAGH